jgi:NAD(P)-dependent dehydrogenase (short-subunit alcohol dehydrogenase family)
MATENSPVAVAVVTGASSGIGLATVLSLHARGYHVVAAMRKPSSAPASLAALPGRISIVPLDVIDEESVTKMADWLMSAEGPRRCDVVVNNAGYGIPGTLETVSTDAAKQVFDVNVWGVMRICKALMPILRAGGRGGLVVLVSSTSGVRGLPCSDIYVASKMA